MSHQQKMSWSYLPAFIRQQVTTRWGAAGLGDGLVYHWIREDPPAAYRGPLPVGRLLRRSRG